MLVNRTTTAKNRAANPQNAARSTGPSTAEGREQSKQNAFRDGRYAARPDPEALLAADLSEREAEERALGRRETRRAYGIPLDAGPGSDSVGDGPEAFGAAPLVDELADLRFELRRLERARDVVWQRESQLAQLETRRRHQRLGDRRLPGNIPEVHRLGLWHQPESPAKWYECGRALRFAADELEQGNFTEVSAALRAFGGFYGVWRMQEAIKIAERCRELKPGPERDRDARALGQWLKKELQQVEETERLYQAERDLEDETAQAARILEAMGSRRWAWMERREHELRRAIDRKLRILLQLGKQADRRAREAARSAGFQPASNEPQPAAPPTASAGFQPASNEPELGVAPTGGTPGREGEEAGSRRQAGATNPAQPAQKNTSKTRNEAGRCNGINEGTEPSAPGRPRPAPSEPAEPAPIPPPPAPPDREGGAGPAAEGPVS